MTAEDSRRRWNRLLALGAALLSSLAIIGVMTGDFVVDVLIGLSIDGSILLIYLASACGWGWWIVRRGPEALRLVTATAIGLGWMGLLILGLGLAGLLSSYTIGALMVIGLALLLPALWGKKTPSPVYARERVGVRVREGNQSSEALTPALSHEYMGEGARHAGWASPAGSWAIWWVVPFAIVLALALTAASIPPGFLWKPLDPHPYDVLSYHLQVPHEWYDAGKIIPLKHNAFSYFPMLMEMHDLAAMHLRRGPWNGMYLCQLFSLAHGALAVIAVARIAQALGATSNRAWSAALLVACVPWMFQLSTVAYVEPGVMLYTTLAIGWSLAALREPSRASIVIVGLCAGLACGMKYTAFVMTGVPVVGGMAIVGLLRKPGRQRIVDIALLMMVTGLAVVPWLARNWAWTGNPVFPLATEIFGRAHFEADQVDRYRTAHRPPEGEASLSARARNAWLRTVVDKQFGYVILPAGLAALVGLIAVHRRRGAFLGAMIVAMILVWLCATHVIPRFISPVIPLLGLAIALAPVPPMLTLAVAVAQAVTGLVLLWGWLEPTLPLGRQGLFRMSDLSVIETEETSAARNSNQKIALIGDAQAFFYNVPSDRLIYRSVFDVHIPEGVSLIDGWVGESVQSLRRRGVWVVVNASELNRLSQTYRHLPPSNLPINPPLIVLPPTNR